MAAIRWSGVSRDAFILANEMKGFSVRHTKIIVLAVALLVWNPCEAAENSPGPVNSPKPGSVADEILEEKPAETLSSASSRGWAACLCSAGVARGRSRRRTRPERRGRAGWPFQIRQSLSRRPVPACDDLGQGWKVRPFIRINARETATLMDVAGSGTIQHIWMVEGLNRGLVIRFYWDDEETPSIEAPAPDFFAVGHGRFAPVNSLAVVVNPANALNCFWPMPFRKRGGSPYQTRQPRMFRSSPIKSLTWRAKSPPRLALSTPSIAGLRPPNGILTRSWTA